MVPEEESGEQSEEAALDFVVDQADIDSDNYAQILAERKSRCYSLSYLPMVHLFLTSLTVTGERELKRRSQPVQRDLPRPSDVNQNIMRKVGPNDPPLNDLQKVPHHTSLTISTLCLPYLLSADCLRPPLTVSAHH